MENKIYYINLDKEQILLIPEHWVARIKNQINSRANQMIVIVNATGETK